MLWSPFRPPERYRPHYLFILACISTSSFFQIIHTGILRYSPGTVLTLVKTSSSTYPYPASSCAKPSTVFTRAPITARITPILTCVLLPETIKGEIYTALTYVLYKESIEGNAHNCTRNMYLLHYPALFLKHSTEGTHTHKLRDKAHFLFNLPNVRPVFPIFLHDLLHFRNPERLPDRDRRLRCFQA